jgi:hypothetical protein
MRMRLSHPLALAVVLAALAVAACDAPGTMEPGVSATSPEALLARGAPPADAPASVHAQTARDELLKSVRQATARFNSTTQALRAGYQPDDHCVAVPGLGGMGYHWVNEDLVGPFWDPREPQVLLYAPGRGGNLRLVGVEYIVIDVPDIEQEHPHFGDQPFDVGGTPIPDPHWSLHVWLYEDNPNGMFAPFNPNVSCP